MAGSHTLEPFINGVAREVEDPEAKRQRVGAAAGGRDRHGHAPRSAPRRARGATCGSTRSARAPTSRRFSSTAASPTLNLGYGGEDDGGIYHSIYDDFYHYTHFEDTDFAYGRAGSRRRSGTAVIRLADADLLPFDFTRLADTVKGYVDEAAGAAEANGRTRCASATGRSRTACSRRRAIRAGRWSRRPSSRCRRR